MYGRFTDVMSEELAIVKMGSLMPTIAARYPPISFGLLVAKDSVDLVFCVLIDCQGFSGSFTFHFGPSHSRVP